jgi:hypothetical protein
MRQQLHGLGWFVIALSSAVGACSNSTAVTASSTGGAGGSGGNPGNTGLGIGEACTTVDTCRAGLSCVADACALGHSLADGDHCVLSGECQDGLVCVLGACTQAGSSVAGETCSSDADCASGLRCAFVGLSLQCVTEGDTDLGGACQVGTDCLGGLMCLDAQCQVAPPGVPTFGPLPSYAGVDCEPASTTDIRAYFEVPGADGALLGDFFRLPFPNDIRMVDGHPDLADFPTPGPGPTGVDMVRRYADAVSADADGWSAYPTVFFRFSGEIDFDSFRSGSGFAPTWVDVTATATEYGWNAGNYYGWSPSDGKYICNNWMAIRRPRGFPLLPGHTYAVWLDTRSRTAGGAAIQRSPQFEAMLADQTPTDAALAAAHAKYAPLRAYLADTPMDPPPADQILNAAVFTVGHVRDPMQAVADAVNGAMIPTARSWVKCAAGVTSPCPQADGDRACGPGTDLFDEYHALVQLPVFQQGTAPYQDAGGNVDPTATPRLEEVCMALTVPKGTMPTTGWPLVVYAHGTGGSFRAHVDDGIAVALSQAATATGQAVPFAVLGIDQVEHGPRRGSSTASPNDLYANYTNPDAARGNPLQGAADQIALARLVVGLDVTVDGTRILVDPAAIVYLGHSQGATEGSLALPYVDTYRAAVLSGNGASLMHALLGKTSPVNVATAVAFVLGDVAGDGSLPGGDTHPVLGLLQHWMDAADPLNFGQLIGRAPLTGHASKHVFQTYGIGDTYSPPATLDTFAVASGLEEAAADASVTSPVDIVGLTALPVPVSGNVTVDTLPITLVVRQYAPPAGRDGHFVLYRTPAATADAVRFLAMAAAGETPQVGP